MVTCPLLIPARRFADIYNNFAEFEGFKGLCRSFTAEYTR
jgi:hypothetical protein